MDAEKARKTAKKIKGSRAGQETFDKPVGHAHSEGTVFQEGGFEHLEPTRSKPKAKKMPRSRQEGTATFRVTVSKKHNTTLRLLAMFAEQDGKLNIPYGEDGRSAYLNLLVEEVLEDLSEKYESVFRQLAA
jgi:hypothetical protein